MFCFDNHVLALDWSLLVHDLINKYGASCFVEGLDLNEFGLWMVVGDGDGYLAEAGGVDVEKNSKIYLRIKAGPG